MKKIKNMNDVEFSEKILGIKLMPFQKEIYNDLKDVKGIRWVTKRKIGRVLEIIK